MRSFYFFRYDSKLLRLGINEQVVSFLGHESTCWSFCSLAGAVIVSAEAVTVSAQLLQKLLQLPLELFLVFSAKFSLLKNIFDKVLEM